MFIEIVQIFNKQKAVIVYLIFYYKFLKEHQNAFRER